MNGKPIKLGEIIWTWLTWQPLQLLLIAAAATWGAFCALGWGQGWSFPLMQFVSTSTEALALATPIVLIAGLRRRLGIGDLIQTKRRRLVDALIVLAVCAAMFVVAVHTTAKSLGYVWSVNFGGGIRRSSIVRTLYHAPASAHVGLALQMALAAWAAESLSTFFAVIFAGICLSLKSFALASEPGMSLLFFHTTLGRYLPPALPLPEDGWAAATPWLGVAVLAAAALLWRIARGDHGESGLIRAAGRFDEAFLAWLSWRPLRWVFYLAVICIFLLSFGSPGRGSFLFLFYLRGDFRGDWRWEILALLSTVIAPLTMVLLPVALAWRVKLHLQDWRSTLVPGHRRAHLAVFTSLAAVFLVVLLVVPASLEVERANWQRSEFVITELQTREGPKEALLIPCRNDSEIRYWYDTQEQLVQANRQATFMGLIVLVAAALGWVTVLGWAALALILTCLAVVVPMYMVWGSFGTTGKLLAMLTPGEIVAADLLLLAGLWIRLAVMRGTGEGRGADDHAEWLSQFLVGHKGLPAGALGGASLLKRAAHRRVVGLGRRFCMIVAAYLAVLVGAAPLFWGDSTWLYHLGYPFASLIVAAITATLAVGLAWPQRIASLGDVEMLRPAQRRKFVQEIGLAMLWDMAEVCAMTLVAVLIPIAYWSPDAIVSPRFWAAALAAVFSEMLAFGAIGCTVWLRREAISTAVLAVVLAATAVLIHFALDNRQLAPAAVAGLIGVGLAAHAYRRWQKAGAL